MFIFKYYLAFLVPRPSTRSVLFIISSYICMAHMSNATRPSRKIKSNKTKNVIQIVVQISLGMVAN